MKERPILFSAPMVRAILAGSKTQTRRAVAFPRSRDAFVMVDNGRGWWPYQSDDGESELCNDGMEHPYSSPYGQPGDRLWVRETWRGIVQINGPHEGYATGVAKYVPDRQYCKRVEYAATQEPGGEPWRPSIHMPRWASRLALEVTGVRVERLQDISEADAIAEGAPGGHGAIPDYEYSATPHEHFRDLWTRTYSRAAWEANPWLWVIEFKRTLS